MISKQLLKFLRERYEKHFRSRSILIKETRDILSASKQAIFAFHRDDMKDGQRLLKQAEDGLKSINQRFIKEHSYLLYEGSLKAAQEEFIEAKFFSMILTGKKLDLVKDIEINFESYFGGLCDLTGEIVRKSVNLASLGEDKKIFYFKEVIDEIINELIKFNLIGYLRVKYDQAKNNLIRIEKICYDINLKK
ncbi:MAG: hypothetical protein GWO87_00455 [Xanthomonadaceae bacterium]|nr:hypothetical protein [Rhodospirillaceae bacterium]NIA17652.1 hypothetical protein [Xanthomonadaceae bacterium]